MSVNGRYIYITVNPKGGENCNITFLVQGFTDQDAAKASIKEFPHCYVGSVWLDEDVSPQLMAAAPELLEALKNCVATMQKCRGILQTSSSTPGNWGMLETTAAEAVIKKAEGNAN